MSNSPFSIFKSFIQPQPERDKEGKRGEGERRRREEKERGEGEERRRGEKERGEE